jgi:hypothetical protein
MVIGPRPGQSVRSFFNSSMVRPGASWPWACAIVSTATVSPESIVSRGSSALSNQPHWVVSMVAGRTCMRPGYFEPGTTMSFWALDIADGGCCCPTVAPANARTAVPAAKIVKTWFNRCMAAPEWFFDEP